MLSDPSQIEGTEKLVDKWWGDQRAMKSRNGNNCESTFLNTADGFTDGLVLNFKTGAPDRQGG